MSTKKDKFSSKDNNYMRIAINLAKARKGLTGENPSVGCVIVKKDKIISIGQTGFNGRPHAEINAIENSDENLSGSKMYVTLEPCNHYGKTPPCTKSIINSGIKELFYSINDIDKKVKDFESLLLDYAKTKTIYNYDSEHNTCYVVWNKDMLMKKQTDWMMTMTVQNLLQHDFKNIAITTHPFKSDLKFRKLIFKNYKTVLKQFKYVNLPIEKPGFNSAYSVYTIKLENRSKLIKNFKKHKIPFNIYYPKPLSEIIHGKNKNKNFPIAKKLCKQVISLPINDDIFKQNKLKKLIKSFENV